MESYNIKKKYDGIIRNEIKDSIFIIGGDYGCIQSRALLNQLLESIEIKVKVPSDISSN
jgi:hypothetical protein